MRKNTNDNLYQLRLQEIPKLEKLVISQFEDETGRSRATYYRKKKEIERDMKD